MLPFLILLRRMAFLAIGMTVFIATADAFFFSLFIALPLVVTWINYAWQKIFGKQPKKFWHISNVSEGLIAAFVATVALAIIIIPFALSNSNITISPAGAKRLTILFFILAAAIYGIIGYLETINPFKSRKKVVEQKQPKPVQADPNKTPLTKSESSSVDQELYRLKQQIQSKDGYFTQTKPEPRDRPRKKPNP